MATNRSATVGNKFVTVRRRLSADEQRDIKSLYVKVGKIDGYIRSRGRAVFQRRILNEFFPINAFLIFD